MHHPTVAVARFYFSTTSCPAPVLHHPLLFPIHFHLSFSCFLHFSRFPPQPYFLLYLLQSICSRTPHQVNILQPPIRARVPDPEWITGHKHLSSGSKSGQDELLSSTEMTAAIRKDETLAKWFSLPAF